MLKIFKYFIIAVLIYNSNFYSQNSPDYIFGNDMGNGWSYLEGSEAETNIGNSFKWTFQANQNGEQFFKFGETS